MAKVKGLVVEIAGDTSELQKALNDAAKQSQSLVGELKSINTALNFNSVVKNHDLLKQKQDVLKQSIKETKDLLARLREEQRSYIDGGGDLNTPQYRLLQRQIAKTENTLSRLKASHDGFLKAGEKITNLSEGFKKLSNNLDEIGNKLSKYVTLPIVAVASAGLKTNAEIERMTTSMATFLGSTEEAAKVVERIRETASNTTFDTNSFIKANQMLISTGESAEDAAKTINALGDAVIATGGGNDELTRMAANLQQIKNAGKATAMDIRQFAYAGIDIYGLLASSLGMTAQELKEKITGSNAEIEVSYELVNEALKKASEEGGKYYGATANSSKTLVGQTNKLKASVTNLTADLTKSLMPVAKDLIAKAQELVKKFSSLSDAEKKQIVNIGLIIAAAAPAIKILSTATNLIGGVVKGIGTMSTTIGVLRSGMDSANKTANALAHGISALTSPAGLAMVALGAMATCIALLVAEENKHKAKLEEVSKGASDYVEGIKTATSHLEAFNSTLFASNEEQQELQQNMQEIQDGITLIAETASKERRSYTEEEIKQLDEYFEKLRELKNKEVQIQQQIAGAITKQAMANAQTFQGSLEEYKVQSQEWINTATQQKDKTIALLKTQAIQEIALLDTKYGDQADMQNEAYAAEYNRIIANKDTKIQEANDEIAKIQAVYAQGYLERAKADDSFYTKVQETLNKQETLSENHAKKIDQIKKGELWYVTDTYAALQNENESYTRWQQDNWKKLYSNMSDEEAKELGTWMAMLANTELYGGKIDDETKKIVDQIIASYDKMPDGTKNAMKQSMQGMIEGMKEQEPSLFARAKSIADGVLSTLTKVFDIHSPSKETKKIFQYVMEGAEEGLASEEDALNKEIDNIAKTITTKFSQIAGVNMGDIQGKVIDAQKTIFTTPEITFNVQKMDEDNLNQCFNYINRRFGSAY